MFTEGIYPIGDGLLDIDEERLKGLLVQDDINEIYDVEQTPFARGKFAAVRRAIHKKSGVHFAAKFLKRRRRAQSSDKEIKHEIAVLMLCDGADNIVKLNAVHETRSDTALLLELATGGELQTFLDNEECLSEAQARICMREVLKALQFLHKRSIAHLDLKPQNILLTSERIEDGLKLCDFGISRVVAEGTNVREIVGTPDYVAPEVLQYEPLSLLTDIWSVGVLAYVLLSGFSPFGGETKQETFLNISQCALTFPDKLFGGVSAAAIDFIRRALRIKPNDRMTAAGCLEHIWLKDECSIDRQIFNNISRKKPVGLDESDDDADGDGDDDDEDEEDGEEDEEDDVDENVDDDEEDAAQVEVDELEEEVVRRFDEVAAHADISNGCGGGGGKAANGVAKMESSDGEHEAAPESHTPNGKAHSSKGVAASSATHYGTVPKYSGVKCSKSAPTPTPATTTTTAVLTVPPKARATTIPIGGLREPLVARRHSSSDANKENTFLATKKIMPHTATATAVATATPTTTATATIIITPTVELSPMGIVTNVAIKSSNSSSSSISSSSNGGGGGGGSSTNMTLPNGCSGDKMSASTATCAAGQQQQQQQQHCLFPDAPTTPKVIRKAPTTDTSPTSVKALVKKFQLEGGDKQQTLKEAHGNHQHQHQHQHQHHHHQHQHQHQQHQLQQQHSQMNGTKSPAATAVNGKLCIKLPEKNRSDGDKTKKYTGCHSLNSTSSTNGSSVASRHSINNNSSSSNSSSSNNITRRASEPAASIHKKMSHSAQDSGSALSATAIAGSFKSTCVFGLNSNGTTTVTTTPHGCRHSSVSLAVVTTNGSTTSTAAVAAAAAATATATAAASGTATTTPPAANSPTSSSSSSSTAILFSNHHQLQHHHAHAHAHAHPHPHHHHHHHHHVVAKGAANNLSLDQGIIC